MKSIGRRNAIFVAVAIVISLPLPAFAKPPLLWSGRGENNREEVSAAAEANAFNGLWKLFDAAADKAYQEQSYRDSAVICLMGYLSAMAAEDQAEMYRSAWLMAFSYHFQGAADSALTAYRLALDHVIPGMLVSLDRDENDRRVAELDSDHLAAKTLLNVGVLCTNARKMDSAEWFFRRVINLAKLEPARTEAEAWFMKHMLARAQSGLADLYTERFLYDKSIPLYEESRKIFEAEFNYTQFRERSADKQLPFRERIGTKVDFAHCLGSLGGAYSDEPQPNLSEARRDLEMSLQLRKELKNNVYIADSQILLSKLELAEHNYNQAYDLSVSAANLTVQGSAGDNPDIHWQALLAEGQSLLKVDRLDEASAALKAAIDTVENLKDPDLGGDENSSFFNSVTWFFRQKVSPYVAMAELLIRQNKPLEALRYSELAKARTLLLGRPMGAISRAGSLGATTVSLDQLSTALMIDIPDQKTAVLEYLQGIDTGYVFLVARDAADRATVKVKAITSEVARGAASDQVVAGSATDLDSAIDQFRSQIEKSYAAYPQVLGRALYGKLVKPFERELVGKTQLILVPAGKLWELPFQALLAPKGEQTGYLIESYSISYAPSLLFLNRLVTRSNSDTPGRTFLLFGNLMSESQNSVASDFDDIRAVFGREPQVLPGKSFLGGQATRDRFLREAPDSKLILFATHAVVGGGDPTQSYFVLTTDSGTVSRERLTAADVMSRQLNANLVVLMACETELGRLVEGEGEVGLGWAFLDAGCASTVVTQWKVDRDSSLDLTARFCRQLAQRLQALRADISLADLLRSTQLNLLSDERYSHPFYWDGMVLVGDPNWRASVANSAKASKDR
jgi:CHAT domain-containing protein